MFNKIILFILCIIGQNVFSQDCNITIYGQLLDSGTDEKIIDANIYLNERQELFNSDVQGKFQIESLCAQDYHLTISHVACETKYIHLAISKDTFLFIYFDHSQHELESIEINAPATTQIIGYSSSLNNQSITDNADQNLSTMLENIAGVSSLKNGSAIAKPIIHGMYGNRISILNNGIAQSGQQWGNDHSPEIDPLTAKKLTVIKGASSLEFPGNNLGAVVLVEPSKIDKEPHLHGKSQYFYNSNGRGHGLHTELQQSNKFLAWKFNVTGKLIGDHSAPNYYLNNTGSKSGNFALQLEKSFNSTVFTDLYFSSFNSSIGILRGSHIGNLTDLEDAFIRNEPFYLFLGGNKCQECNYSNEKNNDLLTNHLCLVAANANNTCD